MVAVTCLLVLACAWTAAAGAIPGLGEACKWIQTGQLDGKPIQLDQTPLKEGQANWRVLIPDIPECPQGYLGVKALVCDYDVAPGAFFESLYIIDVFRKGGLLYPGSVTPSVYCGLPEHQNNQPLLSVVPLSQGQSSLGLSPLSHLDLSHNALLGKSQQYVLPSLSAVPLSPGQSALPSLSHHLHPLSLLDQSHNLLLDQSPLQLLNLRQSPQLLSSQSSLPLLHLGQLPQLHSSQSSLPVSARSPLLLGQCSQHLLEQSPLLLEQPSLPLLENSSQNLIASL